MRQLKKANKGSHVGVFIPKKYWVFSDGVEEALSTSKCTIDFILDKDYSVGDVVNVKRLVEQWVKDYENMTISYIVSETLPKHKGKRLTAWFGMLVDCIIIVNTDHDRNAKNYLESQKIFNDIIAEEIKRIYSASGGE